ncbi:unnamed protein product [Rotaria magnacalcarata]|uniref:Uncharacterized protein n=2 Tax=Rotaria magnacalcarata TaxID=392030 RepID=A0A814VCQ5_9BILA|nr:unnamed protein product [Rotaria magnacalcarata]CAF1640151.1 unnamed protein product [Rotaria magnacalcarata]CAF3818431.1 unnamed protein product [Rotaria magnacalcarata]
MGHYGKHIIDPETGLCEICDKDAISDIRHGKAPPKQVYYSKHDDELTHRSNNDEPPYDEDQYSYEMDDRRTPRLVRRIVRPAPTVRPRRVVSDEPREQPIVIRRKVIRRVPPPSSPPSEEDVIHRSPPRLKPYYYVDREGQMVPQDYSPPPEPPRRYVVQSMNPPPRRTMRVARRRAHTPSPPINETRRSGPKRQINSDTEIVDRQQRIRHYDRNHSPPPPPPPPPPPLKNPEMYHIVGKPTNDQHFKSDSPIPMSHEDITPPTKVIRHAHDNRRPQQHEPVPRKIYDEPTPRRNLNEPMRRKNPYEPFQRRNNVEPMPKINHTEYSPRKSIMESEPNGVQRVYRKPPPGKSIPYDDGRHSNENLPRIVRNEKNRPPPPRQYVSTPQLTNRTPEPTKNPSVYYIRSVNEH